jgi:hypothetical protein
MRKMSKNPHTGSSFDDFLKEEGIYGECTAAALKRVLAWQVEQEMCRTVTTFQQDILEIRAKIQGLPGQKAWGVALGQGSFLTMEFGKPVQPTKANETVHGEWHLWLYGCAWRLEERERIIVSSEDEHSKIEREIQRLEGRVLQSFELLTPALDAVVSFEDNVVLRLFSIYTEDMDSWMLFTPDKVITVGPAGQWSYEA